jgi:hypothetical protein
MLTNTTVSDIEVSLCNILLIISVTRFERHELSRLWVSKHAGEWWCVPPNLPNA